MNKILKLGKMKPYVPNKYAKEVEERALEQVAKDKKYPKSLEEVIRQRDAAESQYRERLEKEALRRLK